MATIISAGTTTLRSHPEARSLPTALAVGQGLLYLATGVWPLVHIESFQAVTGPKTDLWLVQTVGVLVSVIGAVLLSAASAKRITPEVVLLAVGAAVGLAVIDVVFVVRGVISTVYLADAAVEIALAAGWAYAALRK